MKKIYFASPLFTQMELRYNSYVAELIRSGVQDVHVFLPQEQMEINDKNQYADSTMIATFDTDALLESDLMIAVLDGQVIDAGVASEIGVAFQAGIPIIGLYTDSRQMGGDHPQKIKALLEIGESQFPYVNLYTIGLIKRNGVLVNSEANLLDAIESYLTEIQMPTLD